MWPRLLSQPLSSSQLSAASTTMVCTHPWSTRTLSSARLRPRLIPPSSLTPTPVCTAASTKWPSLSLTPLASPTMSPMWPRLLSQPLSSSQLSAASTTMVCTHPWSTLTSSSVRLRLTQRLSTTETTATESPLTPPATLATQPVTLSTTLTTQSTDTTTTPDTTATPTESKYTKKSCVLL